MNKNQTPQKTAYIKLGNQAFRNRSYPDAIKLYRLAIQSYRSLHSILRYNIHVAKKRLLETEPEHPLVSTFFDGSFYLHQNPDVKNSSLDPEDHYYCFGEAEGRWPNRYFDPRYYLRAHPDVKASQVSPFTHYVEYGYEEKREIRQPKRSQKSRGALILVTHDTDVGGAQQVLKLFATWLKTSTRYEVKIIALKGGNLRHSFEEIAPLFVVSEHPSSSQGKLLSKWLGENIAGVFVNSIASADVLKLIDHELPVAVFIHELPNMLNRYKEQVELVRKHAKRIIGGGPDVSDALIKSYNFSEDRVFTNVSFIESLPVNVDMAERRRAARKALTCPDGRFIVMGCGVLHWRKSPDKFIEVAERVLATGIDAEFIWLGGGPDLALCNEIISEKGLQSRVRFTGYEPQVAEKLAAGDLFLLSSQEDPFPLVALYAAQAGMPIVCYKDAGGIESFVSEGSGVAAPYMDVDAMAEAVLAYANDPKKRADDGRIGQIQVKRKHTIEVCGPHLLNHLREITGIAPEVSIVMPNYNYENYLRERLETIASQNFQDFEVILLDDASTDGSACLLEDFAKTRPGCKLVINTENSGSPFLQWMRGMEQASADLIWLAEADDRCTPDFLETMLPFFDDRNVRIASCASQPITAEGEVIGDYRQLYLNRIALGRWDRDYVATDHEEANEGLGIANSIPNASAVVFRKFKPEAEFVQELTSMRLCGDWYFYVRAMRGGLVGFSAKLMNDHRRHGNTVTHKLEGSLRYFDELATVRNYLASTYKQSEATCRKIRMFLEEDITRFKVSDPDALPKPDLSDKDLPCLLVVAPDLSPGGGQIFAISVANEWARQGGRVILLNVANQPTHPAVFAKISSEVTCIEAQEPGADLGTLIQRFDINAIHSGIWWADRWVDDNRAALPDEMPWVISMHGCYETILGRSNIDITFPERMPRMIKRATWVYTATKNLEVFQTYGEPRRLTHIPNGIIEDLSCKKLKREDIGLRLNSTILCLASRAIASKGWFEAVRLTEHLNKDGHAVDLLLIGEGSAADEIRQLMPEHVYLVGQVSNLQDYLTLADIGLLPSSFIGESLPLVLLEMMAKSLPVIASDIGDIPSIIGYGDDAAGIIVPLKDTLVDEVLLYAAVKSLLNKEYRSKLSMAARYRFETKFNFNIMLSKYKTIYGGLSHPQLKGAKR